MYALFLAGVIGVVAVSVAYVASDILWRVLLRGSRLVRLRKRIEWANRMLVRAHRRAADLEGEKARNKILLQRARDHKIRSERRLDTARSQRDFAVRTLVVDDRREGDIFLVTLVNRRARKVGKEVDIMLDQSWANAQVVLVRAESIEEARIIVNEAYPTAFGFQASAVQRAPGDLAALMPAPLSNYAPREAS